MTSLLATLLLAAASAAEPAPAPQGPHAPGAQQAAPESYEEATEQREETLSSVLLAHVSDSPVLEFPGYCRGDFRLDCEYDLRRLFGKSLVFHLGSTVVDLTPTRHLVMLWLASAGLVLVALAAARRRQLVPRGLYNFVELLVQFVRDEIAKKNIGPEDGERFVPFLVTAFFFILAVNLFGLVPWAATATGNIGVTLALAAFTFFITQYAALRSQGLWGYLKHLTGGVSFLLWPITIPVEVMGLFTKPFALTIRLFANMIAGHIVILSLLGLIFALGSPWVAIGSVPMALGIFVLELFVGLVQAYIFTMLSALFIGQGLVHHGHEEEHGHGGGAASDSHVAGKAPGHG